jgi:hypothetical protein
MYSKRANRMIRFQGLADQLRAELDRREVTLDAEIVAWMTIDRMRRSGRRLPTPSSPAARKPRRPSTASPAYAPQGKKQKGVTRFRSCPID